jgi:hypothetical protein
MMKESGTTDRKQVILRRERMARISAIEGIKVPRAVSTRFRDYDTEGLSGDERRARIRKRYRKSENQS